jgi:hypothetical protein
VNRQTVHNAPPQGKARLPSLFDLPTVGKSARDGAARPAVVMVIALDHFVTAGRHTVSLYPPL